MHLHKQHQSSWGIVSKLNALLILYECISSQAVQNINPTFSDIIVHDFRFVIFFLSHAHHHDAVMKGGRQPCFLLVHVIPRGRDSVVDIVTCYRLEGLGIKSWWGVRFSLTSRLALWPNQPPMQWVLCLFPVGKVAGTWHWPPTPSSAEVKERVELYLCHSSSGLSWPVLGWTSPLPLHVLPVLDHW